MRYTILLLFWIANILRAETSPMDTLERANNYYKEKKYSEAIRTYEHLLTSGMESAPLYYNLGNAYFKVNDLGAAILNYERAKKLAPNDADVDFNLTLASRQTKDKIEVIPGFFLRTWWLKLAGQMHPDRWAVAGLCGLIFSLIFTASYLHTGSRGLKNATLFSAAACIFITVISFLLANRQYTSLTDKSEAIVFSPSVTVRGEPDRMSTQLFVLHEGTKVTIVEEEDQWRRIRIADGNTGWMQKSEMEVI